MSTETIITNNLGEVQEIKSDFAIPGLLADATKTIDPAPVRTRWTAHELLTAVFPAPRWFVPKYIPYGYILLGGRPKLGKSWFALQLATAKGSGGRVFDELIPRGKVLYLALEDSSRRLQDRIKKMGVFADADIVFHTQWEPFLEGGFATLQAEIIAHEYQFVVIDTLARALVGKRKIDQNDISDMTAIGANLQQITSTRDITILAIDHHTKPSGYDSDPIDDLLGSTGKSAVPDCVMGLYREQGKKGAVLKSRGRDSEDLDLAIEWDVTTGCWQMLGDANDIRKDSLAADIITAILALTEDGTIPTTTKIASLVNLKASM